MDRDHFIKLTSDIYRITLFFPRKEPLRYLIRESANKIMTDLLIVLQSDIVKSKDLIFSLDKRIDVLSGYFDVAKEQNWVSPNDLLEMQQEYGKIKFEISDIIKAFEASETMQRGAEEMGNVPLVAMAQNESAMSLPQQREESIEATKAETKLTDRQEVITRLLKEHETLQVFEIQKVLSDVTKRTLRRDFKDLLDKGVVKKLGEGNETAYQLS